MFRISLRYAHVKVTLGVKDLYDLVCFIFRAYTAFNTKYAPHVQITSKVTLT